MLGIVSTRKLTRRQRRWPSTPTQDLQDEFLITVRKSQETVIDAIKTWVETVQSITPKIPSVQVPGADKLPKPEEVVASAYDFAEQLLAGQRKFAEEVLKATSLAAAGHRGQHQVSHRPAARRCADQLPTSRTVRGSAGMPALPRTIVSEQGGAP